MFKTARLTYDVSVNLSLHVNCSLRGIGNKSDKHTDRQTDMLIAILRIHLRSEVLKISRPLFIGRIACAQCIKYGLLLQMSLSHVAWSVCLSVCLYVGHTDVPYKKCLTDRDAVWLLTRGWGEQGTT